MKILILTPSISSPGGAERVLTLLANYWKDKHEVVFVTLEGKEDFYKLSSMIKRVNLELDIKASNRMNRLVKLLFVEFRRFIKINRILFKEKPDIVLSFLFITNIIGALASKLTGVPVVLSERNDPQNYPKWKRIIMRYVYQLANGFVCQSAFMKDYAFDKYKIKKIEVIPNPLAEEQFKKTAVSKQPYIISIGRLIPEKNHAMTIEAFSRVASKFENYKLYIFGEGPDRKKIENMIITKGLAKRIELKGVEKDVAINYSSSQLFIMSSNIEGYPNALIEAMANGILSITTDFPSRSARDIIQDGRNGYLIPVNDVDELTRIIDKVLSEPKKYESVAKEGAKVTMNLSLEKISSKWILLFKSIADGN